MKYLIKLIQDTFDYSYNPLFKHIIITEILSDGFLLFFYYYIAASTNFLATILGS